MISLGVILGALIPTSIFISWMLIDNFLGWKENFHYQGYPWNWRALLGSRMYRRWMTEQHE